MTKFGIDVSDYQGKIDWQSVKESGVKFAILRSIQKNMKPDNYFEANFKGCRENGIMLGVYKYGYATTADAAKQEATAVLQLLAGRPLELPVFYDAEDKSQRALPRTLLTQIIRTFLDTIRAGGYQAAIYCNLDWYQNVVDVSVFAGVDFWIARYGNNNGQAADKWKPNVGEVCWQYSSRGQIAGISGNVDVNLLYKDYGQASGPEGETGMTEAQARQKIVDIVTGWLGRSSADGTHKPIIDAYNGHTPLARGYKVKYTDPYCAVTVSAAAIIAGYTDIIPTECGCPRMIELFKKLGRWQENDAHVPQVGDVIFYDWQDTGAGDNTGVPDHVGIVASISGLSIRVIEGNLNGAVGYRTICVNGRYIRGYGVPDYASKAGESGGGAAVNPSVPDSAYKPQSKYKNGSTDEPVYSGTGASGIRIGSLDPYEECDCLGIVDNMAVVLYKVNGTSQKKVGFVKWLGGIKK